MLLSEGTFASDAYDCFVAGSGPAGITLALALADAKKRVLIFESGEEQLPRHELSNAIGYGHYSGGYWNTHWIRMLGGTSSVWAGWCTVPSELDYDNPAVGVRWPITGADLAPYWSRAARALNHDPALVGYEAPLFTGFTFRPIAVAHAVRFGTRYLSTLKASDRIDVVTGCSIVGLDASEARSAVTGVRYFDHKVGAHRQFAITPAQSVVLAAGGIGNPQLLLQPQPDGRVPVGNESGQVGRFLMEHPHLRRAGECVLDAQFGRVLRSDPGRVAAIVADTAVALEHGLYGCSLQYTRRSNDHPVVRHLAAALGRPFHRYAVYARSEMLPSASNRVFLTGEREPSGLYRPAARCVLDARDFLNVEMTLRILGEALIRLDKGRLKVDNDQIYKEIYGGGHIMGTTRMGHDRSTSVVDTECRVHGYANLFVAGSSVFTTGGGYANPTLMIVALSLRLADTISSTT